MQAVIASLLILLTMALSSAAKAQNGCAGSTPVATFKLYAKPNGFAPYPLREVNQLEAGMKVLYQPETISGDDPGDARVTLILAESRRGVSTQRLLILDTKRADRIAEWEVPFRTETVAMVFGPQGFSEGKVTDLLKKDASLIQQLADYAEQNQRVEDLINVLAEAENLPDPSQSLDAALTGFASRYGTPVSAINREAPTSEQAMALMRTLNPALTSYDPLAPDPSQRLQQSAGLAASVAGLFWGSQVALYAGGAGLFLNLRSMMFPGSDFRSALMQTGEEQRMVLCAKDTQRRSRTRLAYLWAARIPDSGAPAVTLTEQSQIGAGLPSVVPVRLSENGAWRYLDRALEWKLISADGQREYPIAIVPDAAAGALRFTPPADAAEGAYRLAARWDWEGFRPNGYLDLHHLPEGNGARIAPASLEKLVENASGVEIALEGRNFRFVEEASLVRKGDPYATPRSVRFRPGTAATTGPPVLFVLLDGEPLERGSYLLTLKQTGGKALEVEVPVMPEPPLLASLPLRLNTGASRQRIVLQGKHLERIDRIESDGVLWERDPAFPNEPAFLGSPKTTSRAGQREALHLILKDRPNPITVPGAVEILGPLPRLAETRIAFQQEAGVALRDGELAAGGLVTALLAVHDGDPRQTLHVGCTSAADQAEALQLRAGQNHPWARLQSADSASLYLTFDPGKIGRHGCEAVARVETANGTSEPTALGRVVRLPKITALALSDELVGENQFAGTIAGEDLESIARVGWNALEGVAITAVPRPVGSDLRQQELRIALPWPAPSPRAPLYIWLHQETEGRLTKIRLGS